MLKVRHQIFVSGTFEDLEKERDAVIQMIQRMGHIPVSMEFFTSSSRPPWDVITNFIDESDYCVLVLGGVYGSIREDGLSYTESEYRYAMDKNVPVSPFLVNDMDAVPKGKTEKDPAAMGKLLKFRRELEATHICDYWKSPDDLNGRVAATLATEITTVPRPGWVRGTAAEDLDNALRQINRLQEQVHHLQIENEKFRSEISDETFDLSQLDDCVAIEGVVEGITWKRVLLCVGPGLLGGISEDIARILLSILSTDQNKESLTMFTEHIMLHLLALGIVDIESRNVPYGSATPINSPSRFVATPQPFWFLTSKGKRVLARLVSTGGQATDGTSAR